jgi:hypothetical protein
LIGEADSGTCPTYVAHGLRVRSELALDAPVTRVSFCDLDIRLGPRRPIPHALPDGPLLARIEVPAGGSSLTGGRGGYLWRVDGLCDFALDQTRRTARVHMAPEAAQEFVSLLLPSFLADLLALDGRCVVHASAVEVGGVAIAFIGGSGIGKSTLAALCCIAGARLVTDDVLRVEVRRDAAWCFSGSHALRLRPAAAVLAEHLGAATRHSTLDERTAVFPEPVGTATVPIAAVVAPRWARDSKELRVERLSGSAALVELLRSPRSIGWTDPDRARSDLNVLADVIATVPLYRAHLPWEPLINPALGRRLLAQIGFETDPRPHSDQQ